MEKRRLLLDVKVKRGADVGSDYQLITALIQLKLRATGKKVLSRKRFDIDKLEDIKVKRDFAIKLQNRYQVLENSVRDENETLDENCNEISDIYTKCSEECIGYKQKTKKKDWITHGTRSISEGSESKQGNLLTSVKEQEKRWAEHFSEILNRPSPKELPTIPEPSFELGISIEPPTISEIVAVVKTLKNGKTPGSDNLNAELTKTDPILAANTLQPIFHKIWKELIVPTEWDKAIDWVMRQTTADIPRGIRWRTFTILEDLDFADDIAMLSHTHQHIQEKSSRIEKYAGQIGLKINTKKTEVMSLNTNNPAPIIINGKSLPQTDTFTYL
ncbi:uncharacterized protein [Mytilus edulis]|uniref:uncharacterized protein n=1 Tax=Mytilus edulis TaxID=6550 RepID=UPI0039F0B2DE